MNYKEFLENKTFIHEDYGFDISEDKLNPMLFDFQKAIVKWALKKGRCAIFADCGLGKTPMQLEWANQICYRDRTAIILILAPLSVNKQTYQEGKKFGINVTMCRSMDDVKDGINIANYEMLEHFDCSKFTGIVLDESSILKSYSGKYRTEIITKFKDTKFKLSCTATPAPNDYTELGNQAEFLNIMTRREMLAVYFTHDGSDTSNWILKGHSENAFFEFLSEWSIWVSKPSDLSFNDDNFKLPKLNIINKTIGVDLTKNTGDMLFRIPDLSASNYYKEKKITIPEKIECLKRIIKENKDEQILIWCDTNEESATIKQALKNGIEIKGSDSIKDKENATDDFKSGKINILISKTSIFGYGLNFQNCHNMVFFGMDYSYENYYQGMRRIYRFGQKKPCNIYIIIAETEKNILNVVLEKETRNEKIFENMCKKINDIKRKNIMKEYIEKKESGKCFTAYCGDSIELIKNLPENSVDFSVFSPPFSELYVYSDSPRDLGNSKNYGVFFEHFEFLIKDVYRILKQGRLCSVHCIDIPAMKERDGYIGIKDFPGDIIRLFQKNGFIYHARHTIWKDPLIEATRTKAIGLMHKQLCKDSSMARSGLPDYLITFRKEGVNENPICHERGLMEYYGKDEPQISKSQIEYSHNVWRHYASPVWMDIRQSYTLQKSEATEDKDNKHICPLQLDTIARAITLWSNEGDTVFSPFMGIGSEGYQAIKMDRNFIGIELKEAYFNVAIKNLNLIEHEKKSEKLF